jgi:hypothetical protein
MQNDGDFVDVIPLYIQLLLDIKQLSFQLMCRCKYCRCTLMYVSRRLRLKRDGTRAETRFRLSPKRMSPFKSAGASVQSTAGSRVVRISGSNAGYTMFRGSVRVLSTHSIRQFPLHFPSRASPCAIRFQTHSTQSSVYTRNHKLLKSQSSCFITFYIRLTILICTNISTAIYKPVSITGNKASRSSTQVL